MHEFRRRIHLPLRMRVLRSSRYIPGTTIQDHWREHHSHQIPFDAWMSEGGDCDCPLTDQWFACHPQTEEQECVSIK
jgi:hypothetical protein